MSFCSILWWKESKQFMVLDAYWQVNFERSFNISIFKYAWYFKELGDSSGKFSQRN